VIRVAFVVETSERTTSPRGGLFTLEMVHFAAFSMAKEDAVMGTYPPSPAKYYSVM